MRKIKVKGGFNRFKIVDAGGYTIGIIGITQIGVEAEIVIVEKGELYQRFEMMHSLKGASKKRPLRERTTGSRVDQVLGALGTIKGGITRLWSTAKIIANWLRTGNNFIIAAIAGLLLYGVIVAVWVW